MKKRDQRIEAMRFLAQRATIGIELLSSPEKAQVLEAVALILPRAEADLAAAWAFALRESMKLQQDFLSLLK
jgi:hypothetical protein